ncbi:MAG: RNA polymerase sigma factor [Armatimonadetes bacterium]|nr:RNA polymerase sigma factor [Armatimonadota bacterium]MBS1712431.1 RNA polymerase sigma factor [Armatimonadota bacterium]MBX3109260.1 RNA polymerase sigma factor [Fimbriimonadaceae bacterium]
MSKAYDHVKPEQFDEDLLLVDRVLSSDPHAFQALYEKYYDRVYGISYGVLRDADEAADAIQEIFTLVYKNLGRFDRRSKFSTWLFRIAVNRSIQQARKLKYKKREAEFDDRIESIPERVPPTEDNDPRINEAMGQLHPNDRAILTLFYGDELSLQEIADSMGCSANAAKTRLFRARERLREAYEKISGETIDGVGL